MLDTNVVLDILHNEREAMVRLADFKGDVLSISYLVYIEVMAGAQMRLKADTEKFLKRFVMMPFDNKAHISGQRLAKRHFVGRENKPMDY